MPATETGEIRHGRHRSLPYVLTRFALLGTVLAAMIGIAPLMTERARAQEGEAVAVPLNQPPYVTGAAEGDIPESVGREVAWRVVRDVAEPKGKAGTRFGR